MRRLLPTWGLGFLAPSFPAHQHLMRGFSSTAAAYAPKSTVINAPKAKASNRKGALIDMPKVQTVGDYAGPAKMYSVGVYDGLLKPMPTPRVLSPALRSKVTKAYAGLNLVEFHKGIAGGLVSAGSLTSAYHLSPTSVVIGWWRCPSCDHTYRRRIYDQCIVHEGECPECKKRPSVDAVYTEQKGKVLMRANTENVFAVRKTGATQQDIPFLANSNRRYSPMLATGWEDRARFYTKDVLLASNKLDGIRCIAAYDPTTKSIHFFSRTGTILESCDHLVKALMPLFKHDNGLVLDGELYAHKTFKDFQEVFSAVRTSRDRITPEVKAIQEKLQYHIFDAMYVTESIAKLPEKAGYAQRVAYLQKMVPKLEGESGRLAVVDGVPVAPANVDKALDDALEAGYEGIMLRDPDGQYEHGKRSVTLIKHKRMYDQEYEIVHCVEGKGKFSGMVGAFICKLENGRRFAANPAATEVMRREMWARKDEYIGQVGTVQYQELTRDSIPRFPVLKCVRGAKNGSNWL